MLLASKALMMKCMDDAEAFVREFIRAVREDPKGPMQRHSHDYDLYLPWLVEEVRNAPPVEGCQESARSKADSIFMDVAWSLVVKGYLRPGPRKVSSEVRASDYGKGFSLTATGCDWLNNEEAAS